MPDREILTRLDALERQNRTLRRWLGACAVLAGSLVWMGQANPFAGEIRARRITLVTDRGEVRAELSEMGGWPTFTLSDASGKVLVRLTGTPQRAVVQYRAAGGELHDLAEPPGTRLLTR